MINSWAMPVLLIRSYRRVADNVPQHAPASTLPTPCGGPSGKREAEIIIDEDGYAELRYWNPPGTTPAEATATALRALSAVIGTMPAPRLRPH
jgi:hypothetical protein